MKKLFVLSCAALALAACTSEEENSLLGGDSSNQASNLVKVSAITRGFGEGSLNVAPTRSGNDMSVLYVQADKNKEVGPDNVMLVTNQISWDYVGVIANKATGFMHGENGWAVKDLATGHLDNDRMTYSWFINEQGERQSLESNSQGLLLVGPNCDLSKFDQNGNRAIFNVGNEWFENSFKRAEDFINAAFATEGTVVNYGGQNPGEVSDLTYTEYNYEGFRVIKVEQTAFQNGSVAGTNDKAKAPWFESLWNSFQTDGNTKTIDHNVVIVPMNDITFSGTNMNCNIFAPGKKVTIAGGGAPSGLVICDELTIMAGTETHGSWTPEFPGKKEDEPVPPVPPTCETNLVIDLDINADYIVIADDFAIQNGDKLYMNAAIPGQEHIGVTDGNGEGAYVFVNKGNNVQIKVDDICDLYPSYIGKVNEDGEPYINEVGELTLVVYLWPGSLDNEGHFSSINVGEGYIIGEENAPVQHAINSADYKIMVSAYKGLQGVGAKEDGTFDQTGWSYVKVSIHIAPRANEASREPIAE